MSGPETEITIKIPVELKRELDAKRVDAGKVALQALEAEVEGTNPWQDYIEVPAKPLSQIRPSDIPPGHFMRLSSITLEEFEQITDEDAWEYLDGILAHHTPESDIHNAILTLLAYKARGALDPASYIIRISRMALSIGKHKPEPDLMIFNRSSFSRKARQDGTESEIIDSPPMLVVEIVSASSQNADEQKAEKYWAKGIQEYWRIFCYDPPVSVTVGYMGTEGYDYQTYGDGEIWSKAVPQFVVSLTDLIDPDSIR